MLLKNKKSIFIIFFTFLSILLTIYTLQQNNEYDISSCNKYLPSNLQNINVEQALSNNPAFLKSGSVFFELNLLPDLNSIFCIGKNMILMGDSDRSAVVLTSEKLFELSTYLILIFLFMLFYKTNYKSLSSFVMTSTAIYIMMSAIFHNKFLYEYVFILLIPLFLIFYIYKEAFSVNEGKGRATFTLINTSLLVLFIFNYNLFTYLVIFYFFIVFNKFKKKDILKVENKLFFVLPMYFYFIRAISSVSTIFDFFWLRISGNTYRTLKRFADLKYSIKVLNCNYNDCEIVNNYGPLWEFFAIDIPVNFTTILLGSLILLFTQFVYFQIYKVNNENMFFNFFLYTSPPVAFALERMNIDVLVVIIIYFAIKLENKNRIISYTLISLVTMIKVYPIFVFFGIGFFRLIKKEFQKLTLVGLFIFINSAVYIYYFYFYNFASRIQDQSGISDSFGLVSDADNISKYFQVNFIKAYVALIFISILFQIFLHFRNTKFIKFNSENSNLELGFIFTFLGISIFSGADFRLVVLIIPIYFLVNVHKSEKIAIIVYVFLFTSVSKNFFGFENFYVKPFYFMTSFLPIFINYLTFYITLNLFSYSLYKNILKKFNKASE